ncbi:unnamed protein product [Pylaiella littoralis]
MCRSTCRSCSVCESHSPFLVRTAQRPACSSTKGTITDYLRYRGARNVLGEVELRQRYTQVSVSYSLSVRGVSLGVKSASQREVLSNVPSSTSGQHSTGTHSTAPSNADMFSRRLGKDGLLTRKFALWTSATVEASGFRMDRVGGARGPSLAAAAAAAAPPPLPPVAAALPPAGTDIIAMVLQLPPHKQRQHRQQQTQSRHFSSSRSVAGDDDAAAAAAVLVESRSGSSDSSGISSKSTNTDRSNREETQGDQRTAQGPTQDGGSSLVSEEVRDGEGDGEEEEEEEEQQEEEEEEEVMAVTRGRKERRDSVTESIVKERERHLVRLAGADVDRAMAKNFKALSLGTRKRPRQAGGFNKAYDRAGKQVHSDFAAGGFARWMGSASKGWPQFKHRLPEVALAGHTNCGKSTLVNSLSGIHPRRGPASTSDRAGWTDLVGFYQVGKKPPVLTLVDLPGYGHAVATRRAMKGWLRMIKEYITTREELIRCCVLVDCTRGFCEEDRSLLQLLARRDIPHQVVLTKADLLTPEMLSACVLLLRRDLSDLVGQERSSAVSFSAVCGSSGAGVTTLWKDLAKLASSAPGSLVAMQAAHLAAKKARDREEALLAAKKASSSRREH